MKYPKEKQIEIRKRINEYATELFNIDFENLSNNQMAWLKCTSLSSVMTMKKAGRSNCYIMHTFQRTLSPETKIERAKKMLAGLSEEDRKAVLEQV